MDGNQLSCAVMARLTPDSSVAGTYASRTPIEPVRRVVCDLSCRPIQIRTSQAQGAWTNVNWRQMCRTSVVLIRNLLLLVTPSYSFDTAAAMLSRTSSALKERYTEALIVEPIALESYLVCVNGLIRCPDVPVASYRQIQNIVVLSVPPTKP